MTKLRVMLMAVAAVMTMALAAQAVELSGSMLVDYSDREGDVAQGILANQQHGQFRMAQTSLRLSHDFSDLNRAAFRIGSGGGTFMISEAWMELGGLPYEGSVTFGQFFKPLGAPIQTTSLSYPALMFHTASVLGGKANFSFYPWRLELGAVNNNPLSDSGTTISGSPAFSRPLRRALTNNKEAYGFLGWQDGGAWGSLDANVGVTVGEFTRRDATLLSNLNYLNNAPDEGTRTTVDAAIDYIYGPARVFGEYVRSNEGRLRLTAWNVGASYRYGKFNFILNHDVLDNNTVRRPLLNYYAGSAAASWRRKRNMASIVYDLESNLQFHATYESNWEDITTLVPQDKKGIRNDGFIFQILALM